MTAFFETLASPVFAVVDFALAAPTTTTVVVVASALAAFVVATLS
jgi:hypothetical protein